MTTRRNKHREIVVDESKLKPAPSLFTQIKHSFVAVIIGVLLTQAILFTLGLGSIVLWWNNIITILFISVCAVMGWVFGDGFIQFLSQKTGDWWDF